MLEHVNAGDHLARLGRIRPIRYCRIVVLNTQRMSHHPLRSERLRQSPLASPVVEQFLDSVLVDDLRHHRRIVR